MKKLFLALIFLVSTQFAFAQAAAPNDGDPGLKVISVKWTKAVSVLPSESLEPDTFKPGQQSPESRVIDRADPPPPMTIDRDRSGWVYTYFVKFRNETGRKIKGVAWDHIFSDPKTNEVLERHAFMDGNSIGDKSTKEFSKSSSTPPINIVDVKNTGKEAPPPANQSVNIKCIIFDDNTAWKNKDVAESVCDDLRWKIKHPLSGVDPVRP